MCWLAVVLLSGGLASGAVAAPSADTRQQLAAEGQALQARHEREQVECRQRFATNACLEDARNRHRRAEADLKARQRSLDDNQRQQRALDRQADIARRQQAVQSRLASPEAASQPRATEARTPPAERRDSEARRSQAAARAKAAERAEASRTLQATIQADQARIRERQARQASQGRKAQPLPLPASAPS
jgi:hypothetical protein